MRIAILWTHLSGYVTSCLQELAARPDVELFVAHIAADPDAPFDATLSEWLPRQYRWKSKRDLDSLEGAIERFRPDVIIVTGWHIAPYRAIMRHWSYRAFRIMTMDNCWTARPKQWLGIATSPLVVKRIADAVWLPGERQAIFARKLGFKTKAILRGLYSCDHEQFALQYQRRLASKDLATDSFLFVGRLVKEKGLTTLISAYSRYRELKSQPWPLICCGSGALEYLLKDVPGVIIKGFVQPKDLAHHFGEASCLVLPSIFEPWGLVVHEATAAGLLVLASDRVGSIPHLVQDGYNGYIFDPFDPHELAGLMHKVSTVPSSRRAEMAAASYSLSLQFTPWRWADALLSFIENHRGGKSDLDDGDFG